MFHTYLTELMKLKRLTTVELAQRMGRSATWVYLLRMGKKKVPKPDIVSDLARHLECTDEEKRKLMSYSFNRALGGQASVLSVNEPQAEYGQEPSKDHTLIPVLGSCPASQKNWVLDQVLKWEPIPKSITRGRRMYLIKAAGDSMDRAGIDNGDLVLVDADREPLNGNIVIISVDHEYTMKRFYKTENRITLAPDSMNPGHVPMMFDSTSEIKLRGVVEAVYLKKLK